MRAFRFRLQAVLTLREQAEQEAQQRCARAYAEVETAAAKLRAAEAAIVASDESRRARLAAGVRVDELEQLRAYAALLQEHRLFLARALAEARQRAEEARRQLVAATQRREALERLRGRQRRAHDYQAARAEQKLLDEMASRTQSPFDAWREVPADL